MLKFYMVRLFKYIRQKMCHSIRFRPAKQLFIKNEFGSVRPYVERHLAALDHRVVPAFVVAGREIVADGNVVSLQVLIEQRGHIGISALASERAVGVGADEERLEFRALVSYQFGLPQ